MRSFEEGDIIIQHQHFEDDHFLPGPDEDKVDTLWEVIEITDAHVRLRLVKGKYEWGFGGIDFQYPGYTSDFASCDNYQRLYPGRHIQQIFDEFRTLTNAPRERCKLLALLLERKQKLAALDATLAYHKHQLEEPLFE